MQSRLRFIYLLIGFFVFFLNSLEISTKANTKDNIVINPSKELSKGNFLIGLKQYLGDSTKNSLDKQSLKFNTENTFLNLYSAN